MNARVLAIAGVTVLGFAGVALAEGVTIDVDVTGIKSWDPLGDSSNASLLIDVVNELGPGAWQLNGIGWDVAIETVGLSWASEARLRVSDSLNVAPGVPPHLFLAVGNGVNAPTALGGQTFSSDGIIKLEDVAISTIPVTSGILELEFYESYDDVANAADCDWLSGTITLQFSQIPAPGALAIFGLAGLTGTRRRKS